MLIFCISGSCSTEQERQERGAREREARERESNIRHTSRRNTPHTPPVYEAAAGLYLVVIIPWLRDVARFPRLRDSVGKGILLLREGFTARGLVPTVLKVPLLVRVVALVGQVAALPPEVLALRADDSRSSPGVLLGVVHWVRRRPLGPVGPSLWARSVGDRVGVEWFGIALVV